MLHAEQDSVLLTHNLGIDAPGICSFQGVTELPTGGVLAKLACLQAIRDPDIQRPFIEKLLAGLIYTIGPLFYIFILAHFVMAILAWPYSSLRVGLKVLQPPGVPQVGQGERKHTHIP